MQGRKSTARGQLADAQAYRAKVIVVSALLLQEFSPERLEDLEARIALQFSFYLNQCSAGLSFPCACSMPQASPHGVQLSLLTRLLDNITGDPSVRDVVNSHLKPATAKLGCRWELRPRAGHSSWGVVLHWC